MASGLTAPALPAGGLPVDWSAERVFAFVKAEYDNPDNELAGKAVGEWPWAFFASQLNTAFGATGFLLPPDAERLGAAVRSSVVNLATNTASVDRFTAAVGGKGAL